MSKQIQNDLPSGSRYIRARNGHMASFEGLLRVGLGFDASSIRLRYCCCTCAKSDAVTCLDLPGARVVVRTLLGLVRTSRNLPSNAKLLWARPI